MHFPEENKNEMIGSYMHKGQGKGGKSEFSPPQKNSGKFVPPSQESFPPSFFLPPFWILGIFSPPVWVLASKSTRKTLKFTKKRGGKFSSPLKILEKFSPGENFPPQFDHLLVHVCMHCIQFLQILFYIYSEYFGNHPQDSTYSRMSAALRIASVTISMWAKACQRNFELEKYILEN